MLIRVRAFFIAVAILIIAVATVSHFTNLWKSTELASCLNADEDATCGHELFERLSLLAANPSETNAEQSVALVIAGALDAKALTPANVESIYAVVQDVITENSAACAIESSRNFALQSLDLDSKRSWVGIRDSAASFEKPVQSTVLNQVSPDLVSMLFEVGENQITNAWLSSLSGSCGD